MPELNETLERKALEALERAKEEKANEEKEAPRTPVVDTSTPIVDQKVFDQKKEETEQVHISQSAPEVEYDVIPAPPTDAEMAAKGKAVASKMTDDDPVIISGSKETTPKATPEDETVILTGIAKENMPNVPADAQNAFIGQLLPEIAEYKKKLILKAGMTPEEAATAAKNRAKKKSVEHNQEYQQEHPEAVILEIDKSKEDDVQKILDEDTKAKIVTARAIKLMVVENKDLETIQVKPKDKKLSVGHLRDISESLSHYSVPLLGFGDYATFIGAQSGLLAAAISEENEHVLVTLQKKAELLYRQFRGGTYQGRTKLNDKGEVIPMTFEEFCNWYRFDDVVMGLYAIVVASSMEETESSIDCPSCRRQFNIKYNNKALLDLSGVSDTLKKRVTDIDEARVSREAMEKIHEECSVNHRFKSPFTENIYELGNPTIAEARKRFVEINNAKEDFEMTGKASDLFLYVNKIWIKDNDGEYYLVDGTEDPVELAQALPELHEVDIQLLWNWFNEMHDSPAFKIHTKCPYCGREATDLLSPDEMLFLQARASLVEIHQ